jgi:hypothetical protein
MLHETTCPMRHLGYCMSGTMPVVMDEGQVLDIGPNSVFDVPDGHDTWVVGDLPWVAVAWGGTERASHEAEPDGSRALATLLFTDIVGSGRGSRHGRFAVAPAVGRTQQPDAGDTEPLPRP